MYSSVGHGGASGYLLFYPNRLCCKRPCLAKAARLEFEFVSCWNCFFRLQKSGFFDVKLALPFIVASIPAAFIGGYLQVDNTVYDILLSLTWSLPHGNVFDQDSHSSVGSQDPLFILR